jgi:hypothetical protein
MGWRWRRSINAGGARATLSKSGVGFSYGFAGLRIGRSPSGNYWVSATIPGTGMSFIKYFDNTKSSLQTSSAVSNQTTKSTTGTATATTPTILSANTSAPNSNKSKNQILLEKMNNIKP